MQIEFSPVQFRVSGTFLTLHWLHLTCFPDFVMLAFLLFLSLLQPIWIFLIFTRVVWCSSSCDELPLLPVSCSWSPCGNWEDQKHDWKGEMYWIAQKPLSTTDLLLKLFGKMMWREQKKWIFFLFGVQKWERFVLHKHAARRNKSSPLTTFHKVKWVSPGSHSSHPAPWNV